MDRLRLPLITASTILFTAFFSLTSYVQAQSVPSTSDLPLACRNVQYLMQQTTTIFNNLDVDPFGGLTYAGGALPQTANLQLPAGTLGHVWVLDAQNLPNLSSPIRIMLDSASADLEVALFVGVRGLTLNGEIYQTVAADEVRSLVYEPIGSAIYTLIVRRRDYSRTPDLNIDYRLMVEFDHLTDAPNLTPSLLQTGVQINDYVIPSQGSTPSPLRLRTHEGLLIQEPIVQTGVTTLLFNSGGRLDFRPWVRSASVVGNDVVLIGQAERRRLIYAEAMDLSALRSNEATEFLRDELVNLQTDWGAVDGLWLLRGCAGVLLRDGRSFLAEIPMEGNRTLATEGTLDDFELRLRGLDAQRNPRAVALDIDWSVTARPASDAYSTTTQVQRIDGWFDLPLRCSRRASIQTDVLQLARWAIPPQASHCDENDTAVPIDAAIGTAPQRLQIDWSNLYSVALAAPAAAEQTLTVTMRDTVTSAVNRDGVTTSRTLPTLRELTAQDEVIEIITEPAATSSQANQVGVSPRVDAQHYRWLPAQESYIELVLASGRPGYDAGAWPDEGNYLPRALNNTGRECYPVNTLLDEVNCAPNGEVNPANGNLWYAVTDHQAFGERIDLTLTRSYNSRLAHIDGLFGYGWQTGLRFDYATVAYDASAATRPVNLLDEPPDYSVMLDLTWQPAGHIVFTTPSGSRHQFIEVTPGQYRAHTNQGWQLQAPSANAPRYMLWQPNGLTYEFDRAGRLRCYGYPDPTQPNPDATASYPYAGCDEPAGVNGRWLRIGYDWETALDGPGTRQADGPQVTITDAPSLRQIELYFDEDQHVTRSILRDLTRSDATAYCDLDDNCFETQYFYNGGALSQVLYPDGQRAHYNYTLNENDEVVSLCYHNDPRAPQLPAAAYRYAADWGGVAAIYANDPAQIATDCGSEAELLWRSFSVEVDPAPLRDGEIWRVTRTDETGFTREFDYAQIQAAGIRERDENFVLLANIGTAADDFSVEEYIWADGLVQTVGQVSIGNQSVWNSTDLSYTTAGELREVDLSGILSSGALPGFTLVDDVLVDGNTQRTISFSDLTNLQFIVTDTGQLRSQVTRSGAALTYIWGQGHITAIETRHENAIIPNETTLERAVYLRDAAGLVTQVAHSVSEGIPYTVTYERDGLGRIITVRDALSGTYALTYGHEEVACERADGSCHTPVITILDPLGADTRYRYDLQGRLLEARVMQGDEHLHCTTYAYYGVDDDVRFWGQLKAQTAWNDIPDDATTPCTGASQARTTAYDYAVVSDPLRRQSGSTLEIRNPQGRVTEYSFDRLGRITRVADAFGNEQRYEYDAAAFEDIREIAQGRRVQFRVREQRIVAGQLERCVDTYFDRARRPVVVELRYGNGTSVTDVIPSCVTDVVQTPLRWRLTYQEAEQDITDTRTTRSEYLWQIIQENTAVSQIIRYGSPLDAEPRVTLEQDVADRSSSTDNAVNTRTERINTTGYIGDVQNGLDDELNRLRVQRCPRSLGRQQVVQYVPTATPDDYASCATLDEDDLDLSLVTWYDAYGRVICERDNNAQRTRLIRYTPAEATWLVQDAFYPEATCGELLTANADLPSVYDQTYIYDAVGNLRELTTADGTHYAYNVDQYGQLIAVTVDRATAPMYRYEYTTAGLLQREEAQDGAGFTYGYDAQGNLTQVQNLQTQNTISYIYDNAGRLTDQIDTQGERTTYQRRVTVDGDVRREILTLTDPVSGIHQYAFDPVALTIDYTDPLNNTTRYSFDNLGILWQINDAAARQHNLTYDELGQLVVWQQANGAQQLRLNYRYDPGSYGVVTQLNEAQTPGWSQSYLFTTEQQLAELRYGGVESLDLQYDELGRLALLDAGIDGSWGFAWQPDARALLLSSGDEVPTRWTYDVDDRLVRYDPVAAPALSYTYEQDRTTIARGDDRAWVVRQGPLSGTLPPRLIVEAGQQSPGQRRIYTFDAAGRVVDVAQETCLPNDADNPRATCDVLLLDDSDIWRVNTSITYNDVGLPLSMVERDQTVESFSYDRAGNLETYQTANRDTFRYSYDVLNRLVRLATPDGLLIFLEYNALDEVIGICQAQDRNDAPQIYAECELSGSILQQYRTDALGRLSYRLFAVPTADTVNLQAQAYRYLDRSTQIDRGPLHEWGLVDAAPSGDARQPINALEIMQPVRLTYTANGLALQALVFGDTRYRFAYDANGRLLTVDGEAGYGYSYDGLGRVQTLDFAALEAEVGYAYETDRTGFSFILPDGQRLETQLNHSGMLQAVAISASDEQTLARLSYRSEDNELIVLAADQQRTAWRLDQLGLLNNFLYRGNAYQISAARDGVGQLRRQSISGSADFLLGEVAQSLLLTYNTDEGRRPLTTRLTDGTGRVLYTVIGTYNTGRLSTEIRQFVDGTQQTITHRYAMRDVDTDQLLSVPQRVATSIVTRERQVTALSSNLLIALVAVFGLRLPRWRWRVLLVSIVLGIGVIFISVSPDQAQAQQHIDYLYSYDAQGNIAALQVLDEDSERCTVAYGYDEANRLVEWSLEGDTDIRRSYSYDGFNRLVQINAQNAQWQLLYAGTQTRPFAMQDDTGQRVLFVQQAGHDLGFLSDADTTEQLIYDGNQNILTTITDEQATTSLTLFDPNLRTIPLDDVAVVDPCRAAVSTSVRPTSLITVAGSIWDAATRLHFIEGRVYDATIERFLQPNPLGPDVMGDLYAYPTQSVMPPIRPWQAPYLQGLQMLSTARAAQGQVTGLRADAVWARNLPTLAGTPQSLALATGLQVSQQQVSAGLNNWLDMPSFVGEQVAAGVINIDPVTGAVRAPATVQLGRSAMMSSPFNPRELLTPNNETSPLQSNPLQMMLAQSQVNETPFTTYVAEAWRPQLNEQIPLFAVQELQISVPSLALSDRLYQTLSEQHLGVELLALIDTVQTNIDRDAAAWANDYLNAAVPQALRLPPASLEEWRQQWFTADTFRVQEQLASVWPVPTAPTGPDVPIGINPTWVEPDEPLPPFAG